MIKIHKEGRLIVAITLVVLLVIIASATLLSSPVVNYIASIASGVTLILVLRFFRVPGKHVCAVVTV